MSDERPPPPCAFCADRHALHFKVWAPLTRREVAMMVCLAVWFGLMVGFELAQWVAGAGICGS